MAYEIRERVGCEVVVLNPGKLPGRKEMRRRALIAGHMRTGAGRG
jgi:hypothetical protein